MLGALGPTLEGGGGSRIRHTVQVGTVAPEDISLTGLLVPVSKITNRGYRYG